MRRPMWLTWSELGNGMDERAEGESGVMVCGAPEARWRKDLKRREWQLSVECCWEVTLGWNCELAIGLTLGEATGDLDTSKSDGMVGWRLDFSGFKRRQLETLNNKTSFKILCFKGREKSRVILVVEVESRKRIFLCLRWETTACLYMDRSMREENFDNARERKKNFSTQFLSRWESIGDSGWVAGLGFGTWGWPCNRREGRVYGHSGDAEQVFFQWLLLYQWTRRQSPANEPRVRAYWRFEESREGVSSPLEDRRAEAALRGSLWSIITRVQWDRSTWLSVFCPSLFSCT